MPTIEPVLQKAILNILPNDYDLAMSIMCQLLANMMLSGNAPWDMPKVTDRLRTELDAYAST